MRWLKAFSSRGVYVLKNKYDMLNQAEMKRKITKLQNRLFKLNVLKQDLREDQNKKEDIQIVPSIFLLEISMVFSNFHYLFFKVLLVK